MSDTVLIVLIIAVVVIIVLVIFRKQVSRFFIKASKEGLEADLTTREPSPSSTATPGSPASVTISGNKQIGKEQKIDVGRPDVAVQENLQLGQEQEIKVRPDPKPPAAKQ
jgi:hypothetical protein